jgi:hypothetical protein
MEPSLEPAKPLVMELRDDSTGSPQEKVKVLDASIAARPNHPFSSSAIVH